MKSIISEWNAEVMLPVPLHKKRFRERGFNQAQLIAERISFWLSKLFGIVLPVDSDYLLRTENTKPQRILDVSARAQNVKKAFVVSTRNGQYAKRSVILIDDIYTSGATLNACAKTLKEAGTEEVFFLTATVV
ncbi:MAG: ComF family protein [Lachnospiraceae bacterium]|nr:ComF family protein [Lachnospiraceae bacterium]